MREDKAGLKDPAGLKEKAFEAEINAALVLKVNRALLHDRWTGAIARPKLTALCCHSLERIAVRPRIGVINGQVDLGPGYIQMVQVER